MKVARPSEPKRLLRRISSAPLLAVALAGWLLPTGPSADAAEERATTASRNVLGSTTWIEPVRPTPAPTAPAPSAQPAPQTAARATTPTPRVRSPNAVPPAVAVRPTDIAPRPEPDAPLPDGLVSMATRETFRGTTYNVTLGRSGGLRLVVMRTGPGDAVVVRFDASGGLIGAGQLTGSLSRDGHLVASGTLMMGRNPFATELEGLVSEDGLVGDVRYSRITEPGGRLSSTRGTFELARG